MASLALWSDFWSWSAGSSTVPNPSPTNSVPFLVGVSHRTYPLSAGAISDSTRNQQVADLIGGRRLQVTRNAAWTNDSTAVYASIRDQFTKLNAQGVRCQFVITPATYGPWWNGTIRTDLSALTAEAYTDVYNALPNITDLCHDIELLNEVSGATTLTNQVPNGQPTVADYQASTAAAAASAIILGACNAVKDYRVANNLPLRIICGCIGRNWNWLNYLTTIGITWDLTGYHMYLWYGSGSTITDTWFGTGGLWNQISQYNKPVTVNEFNCAEIFDADYGNANNDLKTEAGYKSVCLRFNDMKIQTSVDIDSVVCYELSDSTWISGSEGRFGLWWDYSNPKITALLATAFAGGPLTGDERYAIYSRANLLTNAEIIAMQQPSVRIASARMMMGFGA